MRVTNGMLIANFMRDLNTNLRNLAKYQHQLASGRKISRPSDDPVAIVHSLRLRSDLGDIGQFLKNVDHALSWLNLTDTALSQAGDILQRARELAVYGANGTLPQESRNALAEEVKQLFDQLVQVGNTTYAGQYIFAGTMTKTAPFDSGGGFSGNSGTKETEIGRNQKIAYNMTGKEVLKPSQDVDAFQALTNLINHLETGATDQISSTDIAAIDRAIDHLLAVRAEVGARVNRLEMTKSRLDDANINFTDLLAKVEGVDIAQTIMELKNQENVYRAALATGARIIQPTLVDFLR